MDQTAQTTSDCTQCTGADVPTAEERVRGCLTMLLLSRFEKCNRPKKTKQNKTQSTDSVDGSYLQNPLFAAAAAKRFVAFAKDHDGS